LVERAIETESWVEDIYVDSGTGFTAAALLLGLGFFQLPCRVLIVSMTGQNRSDINRLVETYRTEAERLLSVPVSPPEFEVHSPPVGPSFGSVPAASLAEVADFAQREGILVDPIYSAKLSLFYRQNRSAERNALMCVSGGARELLCFQGPLRKWLENQGS
jgi:1-aminocyclopropane-1-carboxylate deaminase/D-cysteine desulfhydrase-like pyridoxal-dependent ACC family enzyme